MKLNAPRIMILLAFLLGLAACYPETKYPLSDEENSFDDPSLTGMWFGGPPDELTDQHYYSFLKTGDDKELDVIGLQFDPGGDEWITLAIHTTKIGENSYMSVRYIGENGEEGDGWDLFVLCRYTIEEENKLTIWVADESVLKASLLENLADGVTPEQVINEDGTIIAPMNILRDVVAKSDPNVLFEDLLGVYKRVS
jgi:hypothetical protein